MAQQHKENTNHLTSKPLKVTNIICSLITHLATRWTQQGKDRFSSSQEADGQKEEKEAEKSQWSLMRTGQRAGAIRWGEKGIELRSRKGDEIRHQGGVNTREKDQSTGKMWAGKREEKRRGERREKGERMLEEGGGCPRRRAEMPSGHAQS